MIKRVSWDVFVIYTRFEKLRIIIEHLVSLKLRGFFASRMTDLHFKPLVYTLNA